MSWLLEHLAAAHEARLLELLALFLIPFLHEDIAILIGGLLVHEYALPLRFALGAIYAGMVASDLLLYALGRFASRNGRLSAKLGLERIDAMKAWVQAHAVRLVVLCRLLPGLMLPVYYGCGALRVPLRRFTLVTVLTATVYLPVVFFLVWSFGGAILSRIGNWSWFLALGVFALVALRRGGRLKWERAIRIARHGPRAAWRAPFAAAPSRESHPGMPSLAHLRRTVARAERIPEILFYIPLAIHWLRLGLRHGSLSLPTLANPKIEVGGLWGESKAAYLDMVAPAERRWLAPYVTLVRSDDAAADLARADAALAAAGLGFPVVAKPDVGWRGFGVQLLRDRQALPAYVAAFPPGLCFLLQRPLDMAGEAGVLYARLPGEPNGHVVSLTLRYFPHVVGDGTSCLRDLVLVGERTAWKAAVHLGFDARHAGADPAALDRVPATGEVVRLSFIGSNRVGGLYRDARAEITPALERRFDAISKAIPEFYYGRYDIRFASVERLREGEDFGIIEINGAGGEAIHVWDPEMPLAQVFRELRAQQRLLFEIGACNRARGYRPAGFGAMLLSAWRQHRMIVRYPPSS